MKTVVHGVVVAGPVTSASPEVAKNLAAEEALAVLRNSTNEKRLSRLCDCRNNAGKMSATTLNGGVGGAVRAVGK